jgi:1-phosphatidylinositol-4-phosphate 5-kinase
LFQRVRLQDGINFAQLFKSLDPKQNRDQIFSSGESSGASGSFFFFSHDRRFIVKTMSKSELVFMDKILSDYYLHLKNYPQSLLARVYGIYSLKMKGIASIHIILMGNTLRWQNRADIYKIYDLKGSTFKRNVEISQRIKATSTLKDVNFLVSNRKF